MHARYGYPARYRRRQGCRDGLDGLEELIKPPKIHASGTEKSPAAARQRRELNGALAVLIGSSVDSGRTHWLSWIQNRSGVKRPTSAQLGTAEIPPLGEAPGQYVMEE